MKRTTLFLLISIFFFSPISAQEIETQTETYQYKLPIWGDKAHERGYRLQLPIGIGINYVYNEMFLDITEFNMGINGHDLSQWLTVESLGFTKTRATAAGINIRVDAWVLPFLSVYGLFSKVGGTTSVSLAPFLAGVQFPEFGSTVNFDSNAYGVGGTLVYGYKNFFISADFNHSWSKTDLLTDQVGVLTTSGRLGKAFNLKKDMRLAFYAGIMYRNFTKSEGSGGAIKVNEALPGIDDAYFNWYDELSPAKKAILNGLYDTIEENTGIDVGDGKLVTGDISYFIKKDLIQSISFQFGGQFEFNKHWGLRGEFGIADELKFILVGVNYRLGF
ncbi:hypothetical protein OAT16_06870 [Prolixibacteraceae bacterium]|nr:hypothetical protein [Prolixibacteraceae bacterium]